MMQASSGAGAGVVAVDDTQEVMEDGTLTFALGELVSNDVAPGAQGLQVSGVQNALHGQASLSAGVVTFLPEQDFNGMASFEYLVTDGTSQDVGLVTVTVLPVNDAPVAAGQTLNIPDVGTTTITLSAVDVDLPAQPLSFGTYSDPIHGTLGTITTASAASATVTFTPTAGYAGGDGFEFTAFDGTDKSMRATISLNIIHVPVCNDGVVEAPETCDDLGNQSGDGCSADCQTEEGYACADMPSSCSPVCNDGFRVLGLEDCDDGNQVETDGCTTQCKPGVLCGTNNPNLAAGDHFATQATTGTCYAAFDDEVATFAAAAAACVTAGGHLVTINSGVEQALVASVQNPSQGPWIGGTDAALEGSFAWLTGETFGYTHYEPGQPDSGGGIVDEDCLHLLGSFAPSGQAGNWDDAACDDASVVGRVCEIPAP